MKKEEDVDMMEIIADVDFHIKEAKKLINKILKKNENSGGLV